MKLILLFFISQYAVNTSKNYRKSRNNIDWLWFLLLKSSINTQRIINLELSSLSSQAKYHHSFINPNKGRGGRG
jgi:CRISPR/Cas system-associated protein endoribonuclease Cas2